MAGRTKDKATVPFVVSAERTQGSSHTGFPPTWERAFALSPVASTTLRFARLAGSARLNVDDLLVDDALHLILFDEAGEPLLDSGQFLGSAAGARPVGCIETIGRALRLTVKLRMESAPKISRFKPTGRSQRSQARLCASRALRTLRV
jgi:hypothetical protein